MALPLSYRCKLHQPLFTRPRTQETLHLSSRNLRITSPPHRRLIVDRVGRNLSTASVSSSSGGAEEASNSKSNSKSLNPSSWVGRYLPEAARPYALLARLDKPIGNWLFAWPYLWSITLAATSGQLPNLKMLTLLGFGAVPLRGANCTINDLLDRDIDAKPHPRGVIIASCFFLSSIMKRVTYWPQLYLGVLVNWGVLLGWAAVKESLDPSIILPLYAAAVFWTLVYDTIYAHQDKEDDIKLGVKSTALRFGSSTKKWISVFGIACIGSLAISGLTAQLAWPYYAFLMVAATQLGWQIWTVDLSKPADCNRKFVSNKWFGAFVFSGILFGRILAS